jgi:predicted ArsR family transcriptional regulator
MLFFPYRATQAGGRRAGHACHSSRTARCAVAAHRQDVTAAAALAAATRVEDHMPEDIAPSTAPVALDRDHFLRNLLRQLAGTLEDVVGVGEASGYISVVGGSIGDQIDNEYRRAIGVEKLTRDQVAGVLVDLKRRIEGQFYIIEETEDRIVLGNRACPFGEYVEGRPSLCMMTSNVFGSIAARNLGYARVQIEEAIALGHPGCRVAVHLKPNENPEPGSREYFGPDR